MYAAFAAVIALVSCNKEPVASEPEQQGDLKAVTINLSNVVPVAKSASTAGDLNDKKAVISNFQVFFTNAAGDKFYEGKNANGTAATHYFTRTAAVETFHFLSAEVTRVIVVANLGEKKTPADVTELMALTANVADQQEPKMNELVMVGETSDLTETGDHTTTHPATKIYAANVSVKPLIARLEVNTFGVQFAKNSLFNSVKIDKLAFDNYFPKANLTGEVLEERERQEWVEYDDPVQLKNAQTTFFGSITGAEWYADLVDASLTEAGTQSVILARDAAVGTNDNPAQTKTHTLNGHYYAYHFFPTAAATVHTANGYPRLYLQVTSTNNQGDEAVQYVMTRNFNGTTAFEAGKIYRVNFTFPDSLLEDPLICADVTIDVVPWTVVELTPDWN